MPIYEDKCDNCDCCFEKLMIAGDEESICCPEGGRDPEIYCKFRTSCPIWFHEKEEKRRLREENDSDRKSAAV